MRHSWKYAPHLEKCTKLGKMRHTWKNTQLEKYAYLKRCGQLGKIWPLWQTLEIPSSKAYLFTLYPCIWQTRHKRYLGIALVTQISSSSRVLGGLTLCACKSPVSCSRFWTGTSLQLRLMRGAFSNANDINLFLMIFPRMSLHCKLVPV